MNPHPKPQIEDLLVHATWVRDLARRLAANTGEADDLEQETWVAALRRPPTNRKNLRGWLTRVLQNLASRSRRTEARRSSLEEGAARPDAEPSVAQLHERAQVQHELVEAVLDLEEPYGSTVLLRYFEGLPPRIIAERQGVPVNTVRTRLSRGLTTLRSRLDSTHGDGRGWTSVLLPLAQDPHWKTHFGLGALLMNTQGKIACAVIVVAVAGTALWRSIGSEPMTVPDGSVSVGGSTALERPPSGSGSLPLELAPVLLDPADSQGRTLVAPLEPTGSAAALVSGRLLMHGGGPAAGARLVLRRQTSHERSGQQEEWVDLTVDADDEGQFEFRFLPPRVHQLEAFDVDASYPGLVPLAWKMILVQAGSRVELGAVTFAEPGWIVVNILDHEGKALVDGWTANAESREPRSGARDSVRVWGVPDRETGAARLEGVPAGDVKVSASHRMGAKLEEVAVSVRPWEGTSVTLFYEGPDLARRITVRIAVPRGVALGVLDPSMLRLEDGLGGVFAPTRVANVTNRFTFDGLEPGLYTVRVEDPRFEPWSQADVRPGEYVEARPVGNAAVRLRVVDARTGEPVVSAEVWGDLHDPSRSRTRFDLPDGVSLDDGSVIHAGLVPSSFSVVARAPGYPEARAAVEDLAAGEERSVTIQLWNTPPLVGRVVQSDGHTPAANVRVQRTIGAEPGWNLDGPVWLGRSKIPPIDEVVTTDQEGVFRFEGLPATGHALRAVHGRWLATSRHVDWPADADRDLLLVLPPYGRLEGRILVPPPRTAAELVMRLDYRDHGDAARTGFLSEHRVQGGELAADGSFELGPLPTGVVHLSYVCGDLGVPTTGANFELGEVTIRAGETTRVEFDERDRFPGKLRIRAYVNGELQETGVVKVGNERNTAGRSLDSRTELIFDDAAPGLWHVGYKETGGSWAYRSPETWLVRPGDTTAIELHIFVQKRSILFVDPVSGLPLRQVGVAWRMGWPVRRPGGAMSNPIGDSATTDDEGRLTLTLPDCAIRFYRGSSPEWDAPHAEVLWTPEATDLRAELPEHE